MGGAYFYTERGASIDIGVESGSDAGYYRSHHQQQRIVLVVNASVRDVADGSNITGAAVKFIWDWDGQQPIITISNYRFS